MKLSLKQANFCLAYVKNGGNATEAAREAGYKGNDETLRSIASQNLTKLNVKERIKELRADEEDRAILSIDQRRKLLSDAAQKNIFSYDPQLVNVGLRAVEMLNKMDGVYVEKKEIKGTYDGPMVLRWLNEGEEYDEEEKPEYVEVEVDDG